MKLIRMRYSRWAEAKLDYSVIFSPIRSTGTMLQFETFFTPDLSDPNRFPNIKKFTFFWDPEDSATGLQSFFYRGNNPKEVRIEQGLFHYGSNNLEIAAADHCFGRMLMDPKHHEDLVRA